MSRLGTCEYCGCTLYNVVNPSGNCFTPLCPNEAYPDEVAAWEEELEYQVEEYHDMIIADRMERSLQLVPIHVEADRTVWAAL